MSRLDGQVHGPDEALLAAAPEGCRRGVLGSASADGGTDMLTAPGARVHVPRKGETRAEADQLARSLRQRACVVAHSTGRDWPAHSGAGAVLVVTDEDSPDEQVPAGETPVVAIVGRRTLNPRPLNAIRIGVSCPMSNRTRHLQHRGGPLL